MLTRIQKLFVTVVAVVVTLVVLAGGVLIWFGLKPVAITNTPVAFEVKPGERLRSVIQQMVAAGLDVPAWQLELFARVTRKTGHIKAGMYEVAAPIAPFDLFGKLTRGEFAMVNVTFVEGWTFREMRALLDAHPGIRHDTSGLSDAEIMQRIGADADTHPEGWFFPDTYRFAKGSSDLEILRQSYKVMARHLDAIWSTRPADSPLATPYQALILASIVEKETGLSTDREMIAGVFTNRLRKRMLLQTDPTVIYGLGTRFDGNLRKRDLQADGPYNTYTRRGLPPTPIAMPGLASLKAAVNPAPTDVLYFVARGDGSSEFSRTMVEHNRAVAQYQLKQKPAKNGAPHAAKDAARDAERTRKAGK